MAFKFYSKLFVGVWVYMHACQRFGEPEALATLQLELRCELSDVAAGTELRYSERALADSPALSLSSPVPAAFQTRPWPGKGQPD